MFYHRAHTDPNLKVAKTSEFHRVVRSPCLISQLQSLPIMTGNSLLCFEVMYCISMSVGQQAVQTE